MTYLQTMRGRELEAAHTALAEPHTHTPQKDAAQSAPLLEVNLTAGYGKRTVVQDLRFDLAVGECFGLVGTSGAGKSTVLLALLGLLSWRGGWARGTVRLRGQNLLSMKEREARRLRGRALALVPQSPAGALNSALSLRTHFQEAWRAHEPLDQPRLQRRLEELFQRTQLPFDPAFLKRKPGQISVGQAQRCALALALLHRPSLLIADEPTSALDPVTQVEVLSLLGEISREEGAAILFVSHDLLSLLRLCSRVGVLYGGKIAECLPMRDLHLAQHPALVRLLETLPVPPEILLKHREEGSSSAKNGLPERW